MLGLDRICLVLWENLAGYSELLFEIFPFERLVLQLYEYETRRRYREGIYIHLSFSVAARWYAACPSISKVELSSSPNDAGVLNLSTAASSGTQGFDRRF